MRSGLARVRGITQF